MVIKYESNIPIFEKGKQCYIQKTEMKISGIFSNFMAVVESNFQEKFP